MNTNKEGRDALKAEGRNQTPGIMMIPIRVYPCLSVACIRSRGTAVGGGGPWRNGDGGNGKL